MPSTGAISPVGISVASTGVYCVAFSMVVARMSFAFDLPD